MPEATDRQAELLGYLEGLLKRHTVDEGWPETEPIRGEDIRVLVDALRAQAERDALKAEVERLKRDRMIDVVRADQIPDYIAEAERQADQADKDFRSGDEIFWDGLSELLRHIGRHIDAAAEARADAADSALARCREALAEARAKAWEGAAQVCERSVGLNGQWYAELIRSAANQSETVDG